MKSYEELLAERDALAAQVNALWVAAQNVLGDKNPETRRRAFNVLANVVKSNPQQCLAAIKAAAIEDCLDSIGAPATRFKNKSDDFTAGFNYCAALAQQQSVGIRKGGTWLRDENVNGGKRQGGE